jgi:phosphate starvation-inducible PhoH-like protein
LENAPQDPHRIERSQDLALSAPVADFMRAEAAARRLEAAVLPFRLTVSPIAEGIRAQGDDVSVMLAERAVERLEEIAKSLGRIDDTVAAEAIGSVIQHAMKFDLAFRLNGVPHPVRPMTLSQVAFMDALLFDPHSMILGLGPTGTGKTHLALAAGLSLLAENSVKHIVITRPHTLFEGEIMTAPLRAELLDRGQLTPIEDELYALLGHEHTKHLFAEGKIEIAPLGFLRGRTFNESFILIDDAQNLTVSEMRMVVTRVGQASRIVLVGDPDQIGLHGDELSGLPDLLELIEGRDLALIHHFERREIIRNRLVAQLEALYARRDGARSVQEAA